MKNIDASVRAKLTKIAREEGIVLDFMIERFAMGRLLWRLSQSPKANQFILKGAQLFTIWEKNPHRLPRNIDFLGFGDPLLKSLTPNKSCSLKAEESERKDLNFGCHRNIKHVQPGVYLLASSNTPFFVSLIGLYQSYRPHLIQAAEYSILNSQLFFQIREEKMELSH